MSIRFIDPQIIRKEIGTYTKTYEWGIPVLTFDCNIEIDAVINLYPTGKYEPIRLSDTRVRITSIEFNLGVQDIQDILTDDAKDFYKNYLGDDFGCNSFDGTQSNEFSPDNAETIYGELDDNDIDYDKIKDIVNHFDATNQYVQAYMLDYQDGSLGFTKPIPYNNEVFGIYVTIQFEDKATEDFIKKSIGVD